MKNRVKYLAILFLAIVGLGACNPDPEITQPTGGNYTTISGALAAIQGTWYLDYREEILYSCGNSTGVVKSTTISDLSYPDFEFQFTQNPNTSIFGSSLSQYETSGALTVNLAGGANSTSYFLYKNGTQGNIFNPYFVGATSNPDQIYIYMNFMLDDEGYSNGGKLSIIDENHMTIELVFGQNGVGNYANRRILHFTKNYSSFAGDSEIQSIKGNYIPNYKEVYVSNVLMQSLSLDPFPMNITDSLVSPIASIDISSGSTIFPAFRGVWYIAHGMNYDWDGSLLTSTSSYYPVGYDNFGNWIGTEGEMIMVKDGFITLSPDALYDRNETLQIISSTPTELVLRSYQGCSDYIDYHFSKVN